MSRPGVPQRDEGEHSDVPKREDEGGEHSDPRLQDMTLKVLSGVHVRDMSTRYSPEEYMYM